MPVILNAADREKNVCAQGNWFYFRPRQIKIIASEPLAHFFTSNLAYEGFVQLTDKFEDPEYKKTAEGKEEYEKAVEKGMNSRIAFLQYIINNELISLKQDLAHKNDASDPRSYVSKQMVEQMKELAQYKEKLSQAHKEHVAQIEELEKKIGA